MCCAPPPSLTQSRACIFRFAIVLNWVTVPRQMPHRAARQPVPFWKDPFTLTPGTWNGNIPELEPQVRVLRNVALLKNLLSNMHTALVLSQHYVNQEWWYTPVIPVLGT